MGAFDGIFGESPRSVRPPTFQECFYCDFLLRERPACRYPNNLLFKRMETKRSLKAQSFPAKIFLFLYYLLETFPHEAIPNMRATYWTFKRIRVG